MSRFVLLGRRIRIKSQLGYVLLMVYDTKDCNIIHLGSIKCKREARSVTAVEVIALVLGFDYATLVRSRVEELKNII